MDEIGAAIGEAIGAFFANPLIATLTVLVGAYVVFVWLASALWAFVDMRRRTSNPIAPYATAAIVILASPLLFPFAIIVHRVLRPDEFISERRLSELRDRALEAEASLVRCPDCHRAVDESWLLCPDCRRPLGHRCHACGGTVGLDWPVCAWCGTNLDAVRPKGRLIARA
jgi:hypothetical protein